MNEIVKNGTSNRQGGECKLRFVPRRIDARVKIAILAFYSVCIFLADTWVGMIAFLLLAVAICMIFKPNIAKMLKLGIVVYVIAALTLLFNAFVFTGDGFSISIEGIQRGAFFALRIILLVMASLVICLTTDSLSISSAIRSYLSPLARFKVPVDDLATIMSISLRFIPLTAKEFFSIKEAQWSRGANFDEGPILSILKAHCAILIPLFINMFRHADALAISMDARGYGISSIKRCDINSARLDFRSVIIGCLVCGTCVLAAIFF